MESHCIISLEMIKFFVWTTRIIFNKVRLKKAKLECLAEYFRILAHIIQLTSDRRIPTITIKWFYNDPICLEIIILLSYFRGRN